MGDATGTDTFPGFERCVEFLRSRDHAVMEDGFSWLLERAPELVEELLALAEAEEDDRDRVTFIDLLGGTKSRRVVPFLERMLRHPHAETRWFALLSLEELGFPETIALARAYRRDHPGEYGPEADG
ncbi:MAG TPA: HEAT repeat domain-containing protein [Longimicrobium sp.]|jgi:HEAT repeat protein